jgi:hypothetical protein
LNEFLYHENRFATIKNNYPEKGEEFLAWPIQVYNAGGKL